MKQLLNLKAFQKWAHWSATLASLFTLVMAPVAQGAEVRNFNTAQVQSALDQAGLNKQITVGEFYAKNKYLFPERIQKEIEPVMTRFKNQMMPQFEVVTSKGPSGDEIPTIRVSQGHDLINLQMFGEAAKFVKFQNTNLTEIDIINFGDMFTKVLAGDERFRKDVEAQSQSKKETTGYPAVTSDTWKKMSQNDRAAYIVNMRLLWNDARLVLIEEQKKNNSKGKARKTSAIDGLIQKWDALLALISPEVEAADAVKKAPPATSKMSAPPGALIKAPVKAGDGSNAYVSGSNCLVAGYVSSYTGSKCGVENRFNSYKSESKDGSIVIDELVKAANDECATRNEGIACNPFVYGTPGGKAACVDPKKPDFQIATHYNGPCESQSSLGSKVDFLADEDLKNSKRYESPNMKLSMAELEAKYKEEQKNNPDYVKNYINGMLQFKKNNAIDFSKPLTDDSLTAIFEIRRVFNKDIETARLSCEKAASNKSNETNFWGACDQLHRRFLNVAQFLEKTPGCPDGYKTISETNLKCMCPASKPDVLPGASCNGGATTVPITCPGGKPDPVADRCVPVPSQPSSGDVSKPPSKKCDAYPTDDNCECPGGGKPNAGTKGTEGGADGAIVYTCKVVAEPGKKADDECGIFCKFGKAVKNNIATILLTGVGLFAAYKLLLVKKPKLNAAADKCPNGAVPQCAQPCPGAQAPVNGICGCPACPQGQSSPPETCVCSSTAPTTPIPSQYTCADGVTKVANESLCPKPKVKCWDGTFEENIFNCKEKPAPVKSKATK